mmetsp:Transcript_5940/g.9658  ORF Transcript_5940/g.9658 Transcript_5940/m.9658 type:complete len:189 (-) Transcript_5940:59-625(-)
MDILVRPNKPLTAVQKEHVEKSFMCIANAYHGIENPNDREIRPLPKSEILKLLQALGRPITKQDGDSLLAGVPNEVQFDHFCELLQKTAQLYEVQFEHFCQLLQKTAHEVSMAVDELTKVLEVFDLSGRGTLDPKKLKDILCGFGDRMSGSDVDEILRTTTLDGKGRIPCRILARRLLQGSSEGIVKV